MKISYKNYLPLIIIVIIFLLVYFIGSRIPEVTIREMIKTAGPLGPIILIIFIWLTNVVAPLSATPFYFVGYYLFGQTTVIYSFIATFIASMTNFWIARIWGRKLVIKLAGEDSLQKIDRLTENYGIQTLFIIRVFLSQFYDVVSYVFGLTPMKFAPYIIISTLGTIPGTLLWYFLSTKVHNPLIFTLLTLGIAYVSLTAYIIWLKVTKKEKLFAKPN